MSAGAVYRADPRELPRPLVAVFGLALGIGVVAFLGGLLTDPRTTWIAFHTNFLYFGTLSQAGLCLGCALVIVGARWAGPVRHVAEALAAWVPVTLILFVVGNLFGREYIHANWLHDPPPGKEGWLSFWRVFTTDLAILAVMTGVSLVYLKASFRPALEGAADRATRAKGMFASWSAGWRGAEAEREASDRRTRVLAPIICLLYAFAWTIVAYDQVMAMQPAWFSNMFGWYFLWGGFLCGVAATALISVLLRTYVPEWTEQITRPRMHDLGKMVFAFSIFWMYLFFSQYIVIWYGNLPEETSFFYPRIGSQFLQDTWYFAWERLGEPYVKLSLVAWAGCWIIPFWMLLGQRPKRTPAILGPVAAIVLLGFWLERNVLVWPALSPEDGGAWLGPIQIGVALGFFGAFGLVYLTFSCIFPTLPLPDSESR